MVYVDQNLVPVRLEMSRGPSFSIAIFIFIAIFEVLRKPLGIRLHIYIARALRALGLDKRNWLLAPNIQIFRSKLHIAHEWGVSLVPWFEGTKSFTSSPPPKRIICPKTAKFGPFDPFGHWPNIGIFGPFDLMPDQKTMQTSCLGGFLLCWYQNFYLLP